MAKQTLTIVFRNGRLDAARALKGIETILARYKVALDGFQLYGQPTTLTKAAAKLKRTGRPAFHLVGQGFDFHLASVRNHNVDFLGIKAEDLMASADEWVAEFWDSPDFVMAWVADSEYEFWQNAEDLLEYSVGKRSHDHLPKKSNGLPPPLEQTIIDTSGNPGRRVLRSGYIEVVGAVMWLGESFWQLTRADRDRLKDESWAQTSSPSPSVLRLHAADKCFTSDEGHERDLQVRLRETLFPQQGGSQGTN
jgi:hypothetical protein